MATAAPARAPALYWIVALVSLVWNGFWAFDYVMTQTNNNWYLAQLWHFNDADRAFFTSIPGWSVAAWAIGVWGALLGSLLLLIRNGFAVWAFGISLAGLLVMTIYQFAMASPPADLATPIMLALTLATWVVAIALFVYAWRMKGAGLLR
jgi:hypothetical protein